MYLWNISSSLRAIKCNLKFEMTTSTDDKSLSMTGCICETFCCLLLIKMHVGIKLRRAIHISGWIRMRMRECVCPPGPPTKCSSSRPGNNNKWPDGYIITFWPKNAMTECVGNPHCRSKPCLKYKKPFFQDLKVFIHEKHSVRKRQESNSRGKHCCANTGKTGGTGSVCELFVSGLRNWMNEHEPSHLAGVPANKHTHTTTSRNALLVVV